MNLINFIEKFPNEATCRAKFKEIRDSEGVKCRKCGSTSHYWLKNIESYECKKCRTRMSLRSGTVMHASKLPFRYWFIAMHLVTSTKKTFSTLELQNQIGHKFYEPIWSMMQKIRSTMGYRDSLYRLNDVIEVDEGFFESVNTDKNTQDKKRKRGRGSQKQSKVLVMSSTEYTGKRKNKNQKVSKFRYVKMIVLDDLKSKTINKEVKEYISQESVVKTDKFRGYSKLKEHVWCHYAQEVKPKDAGKALPWVHTMIANSKRTLLGIHHMISSKYYQNYLNEFCYKVNRRYYGEKLFDRLLIACASTNYKDISNSFR
jgi:hypothetical protein